MRTNIMSIVCIILLTCTLQGLGRIRLWLAISPLGMHDGNRRTMSITHRLTVGLAAATISAGSVALSPNGVLAQNDCTYGSCALRVRRSLIGHRIVRGVQEDKVASIILFAPRLEMWRERSDSANTHYAAFRTKHNIGAAFSLAGVAAFAAGTIIALSDRGNETVPLVAIVSGLTFTVAGFVYLLQARDRLSQAIWWYNGTLVRR